MSEIEFCVKIPRFSSKPRFISLEENELNADIFCEKGNFKSKNIEQIFCDLNCCDHILSVRSFPNSKQVASNQSTVD